MIHNCNCVAPKRGEKMHRPSCASRKNAPSIPKVNQFNKLGRLGP